MARRPENQAENQTEKALVLVEPAVIPVIFVTGVRVAMENNHAIITGWVRLPGTEENRVEFHFAMPNTTARALLAQLGLEIAKGSH